MRLVLSGYYGFNNAGDEAILAALIGGIQQRLEKPEIIVLSAAPERTEKQHGVQAIGRYNYSKLLAVLRRADLLISGGGSLLQDVTGRKTIAYYLSVIGAAKLMRVPVFFCGQGVGPIRSKLNQQLVKATLNRVEKITVRDQKSAIFLTKLGVKPEIKLAADPVFTLQPPPVKEVDRILNQEGIYLEKPTIGIAVRAWSNNQYLEQLAVLLDQLQIELGAQLIMIPFQYPADKQISQRVNKEMKKEAVILKGNYHPQLILGLIGRLDVLIGVRLHSLIFALKQGVLPIGISYDPKVDNLLAQFDLQPVGTTSNLQVDQVYRKIISLWNSKEEIAADCEKKLETAAGLARRNLEVIEQLAWEGQINTNE